MMLVRDWILDLAISSITWIIAPLKFATKVGTSEMIMVNHLLAGSTSTPLKILWIFAWFCKTNYMAPGDASARVNPIRTFCISFIWASTRS